MSAAPQPPTDGRGSSAELDLAAQQRLVLALQAALATRPGAGPVQRFETHISWVLVEGTQALKLKKAVALGFVDFTTLARRRRCCEEELRLNRRLAPDLYLDVLPIAGTPAQPRPGGDGPAIEVAVRMRAFPQHALWDQLARAGGLQPAWIDALARTLATFHEQAEPAPAGSRFGEPARVRVAVLANFEALDGAALDAESRRRLDALRRWEAATYDAIAPLLAQRRAAGRIRECHGDLHLGNIAQVDGRATPFDGIEFDDDLRFVDVISDIAFLAMDLRHHGLPALARRFVDRYLGCTGDYEGARLLRYAIVYRALVRAKVALLRGRQDPAGGGWREDLRRHVALAAHQAGLEPTSEPTSGPGAVPRGRPDDLPPALLVTHGCSGSGKTAGTQRLLEAAGAVRIRADVERKRLAGLPELASSRSQPGTGLYTPSLGAATYRRLLEAAVPVIEGGGAAILDATFLRRAARDDARALAARLGVPFVILDFDAPPSLLRERVRRRLAEGSDASEADEAVLDDQLRQAEPLSAAERRDALACPAAVDAADPGCDDAWRAALDGLDEHLRHAAPRP
jgi:aminoglycoside phosphotransferase family enzyme/predicted kinase